MTSVRNVVATMLVGGTCMMGVTACGGSDKISDASFITRCKKTVEKNATVKAYSADICSCTQDKLKAAGLGSKDPDDKAIETQATNATAACVKQSISG